MLENRLLVEFVAGVVLVFLCWVEVYVVTGEWELPIPICRIAAILIGALILADIIAIGYLFFSALVVAENLTAFWLIYSVKFTILSTMMIHFSFDDFGDLHFTDIFIPMAILSLVVVSIPSFGRLVYLHHIAKDVAAIINIQLIRFS